MAAVGGPARTGARRLAALAIAAACLAGPAHGSERLPAATAARVDSAVRALVQRVQVPGLSIAVVAGGATAWTGAYGLADVEHRVPAHPGTVYRIASTSKPITAVAALQLAERGRLRLDAPVQDYAPAFPRAAHPVTVGHLLSHLSGIRHYRRGEGERTNRYESLTAALDIFRDDPLEHEPGAKFTYTTFGYTLLGVAIEGASGLSYRDYLRTHVLEPAGMSRTRLDDLDTLVADRARGYSPRVYGRFDGRWRNASLMDASYKFPGGGLLSTAEDLARFAIALFDGRLLGAEAFRATWRSRTTSAGIPTGYSDGWYVGPRAATRPEPAMWHGGVQPGFTSTLWMLPERRFAVAILTNLEGGGRLGLEALAAEIADLVAP